MDVELFKKRYLSGVKYKELKKEFGVSFSTINVIRIRMGLPKREKSFERAEVDETKFRELYESREPFYNYSEMAAILGCCEASICNIRRRLNLTDREPKPRISLDEAKFRQMFLNGDSYDKICQHFGICTFSLQKLRKKLGLPDRKNKSTYNEKSFIEAYNAGLSNRALGAMFCMERRTVQKRIQELNLPPRKNVSSYEEEFRKAHKDGLTVPQLAEKFKLSRSQVYVYIRKFGLSYTREKTTVVESVREQKKVKVAKPVVAEHIVEKTPIPKIKEPQRPQLFVPPTLKEIQKMQRDIEIRHAERQYKITHKENGFGSLIGQEIDNPIVAPFSK